MLRDLRRLASTLDARACVFPFIASETGRLLIAGDVLPARALFAASNFFVVGETERDDEQDDPEEEYEEPPAASCGGRTDAVVRFCAGTSIRLVCAAGDTIGFTSGVTTRCSCGTGEGAGVDFFAAAMSRFRAAAVLDSDEASSDSYE